ncbi:MAG: hypothetical protein ABL864_05645 [Terricaulis sp.]
MTGLLTIQEFCSRYGCGRTRAYALLADKKVGGRRFGNRTLIERESAEAWAASLPKWAPTRAALSTESA